MLVVLIDVENIDNIVKPEEKPKQTSETKKKKSCNCNSTMCLRLHCYCFQNNEVCDTSCGCTDCLNKLEYEKVRKFVKKKTEQINPFAFKEKYSQGINTSMIHSRGCKCSKNKCQKNYCECFKNNISCSSLCRCEKCDNDKIIMDKKDVKKVYKNKFRKKHKLVFKTYNSPSFFNFSNSLSDEVKVIAYVPHKNK